MRRLHLFEVEDQPWCPQVVRETITDFLVGLYNILHIYEPAFQKIAEVLQHTKMDTIVDCCSGSGGPIQQLRNYLDRHNKESITITLTDKYPNLELFQQMEAQSNNSLVGYKESIDARHLPSSLKGLRCFFSSFHHFAPDSAVKILQDAVDNKTPIAIFESTQRHIIDFIRAIFSPILMLLIMPFSKRLTFRKFFFLYILPIIPFIFMWDYLVSNMRTYSSKELQQLISQLDAPDYTWEVGVLFSKKAKSQVPYLIGYCV